MTWSPMIIGRHRREILLFEVGNLDVPALFTGLQVERDQVVVGRFKEEVVAPDSDTAIGDVRSASCFPIVVPELPAIARVESPDMVRRGGIEDAIHHQNGALFGNSAGCVFFESFSTDDRPRSRCGIQPADPSESEALDRIAVGLFQSAVSPSGVIAGVGWPGVRKRFEQTDAGSTPPCPWESSNTGNTSNAAIEERFRFHFKVTR